MKRASWALKNTFHELKVCEQLSLAHSRQLQVYRHEYQHFINVMHGYIANQVFQITWREFENDLEKEVLLCVYECILKMYLRLAPTSGENVCTL